MTVAVAVFKDNDAVAQAQVEFHAALGVGVVLGNPEPAPRIPSQTDGILDVGLGGKKCSLKPRRQLDRRRRRCGGQGRRAEVHRCARVGRSREGRPRRCIGRVNAAEKIESNESNKPGAHGDEMDSNNKAPPEESGKRSPPCYSWARP
jgi:hypothetical protein